MEGIHTMRRVPWLCMHAYVLVTVNELPILRCQEEHQRLHIPGGLSIMPDFKSAANAALQDFEERIAYALGESLSLPAMFDTNRTIGS
jgi:hypothetical protein